MVHHKQILDVIKMIHRDTIHDYVKAQDNENKFDIKQLRNEIRENAKLLTELGLGTPIIAQIKARIDKKELLSED